MQVKGILTGGMQSYKEAGYPMEINDRIDLVCERPLWCLSMYIVIHTHTYWHTHMQTKGRTLNSYLAEGSRLLDVRTEGEYKSNTAKGATNLPLASLNSLLSALDLWVMKQSEQQHMYMYMYIVHVYIYIYMYIYIHVDVQVCMCTC